MYILKSWNMATMDLNLPNLFVDNLLKVQDPGLQHFRVRKLRSVAGNAAYSPNLQQIQLRLPSNESREMYSAIRGWFMLTRPPHRLSTNMRGSPLGHQFGERSQLTDIGSNTAL